ncbi:hypothetical protein BS47DRAFT_245323 [Hydnum rufescens UP504]|uniref:Diphthine methyl ester synthase n=1 Tax=Hydnum rufescens UP504 TaxID=1448309 RepID=A0A9P6DRA3_9AGAM|nr:hypothetical protein BS47DRAFT_245323 [Hydnum rufescens UP504]
MLAFSGSLLRSSSHPVETVSDEILSHVSTSDVALLVVGDPFGAATHQNICFGLVLSISQLTSFTMHQS